jgi:hypothetical protein
MLWEGKALRDIRENDLRNILGAGLQEHLQLEYKSELYAESDRGRREFLQDVCMFANTEGGILLIGVPELRDDNGQPTGVPDVAGVLGLEVANPEAVLAGYDARVMDSIEERLPLESAPITVGDGRCVLALRIPNSARKPHSVRHEGHIYFPARRERQRYSMNVREIKELAMRTANRLRDAKEMLKSAAFEAQGANDSPYLVIGILPVFFDDFLVDVRRPDVLRAFRDFGGGPAQFRNPVYSFDGIERREDRRGNKVKLHRNGLLSASYVLPLAPQGHAGEGQHGFFLTFIDARLRRFIADSPDVFGAARIGAPFILGMMLRTQLPLCGGYSDQMNLEYYTLPVPARDYAFPFVQVHNLADIDNTIRPLCDVAHQLFGREGSPSFNNEGVWVAQFAW